MGSNSFGRILTMTTFGESHGRALGAVLDGFPAGVPLSEEDLAPYLARRKPGGHYLSTARGESDRAEILSGVFEGRTTGTPIAMLVYNQDAHPGDYEALKDLYRPGHADYTYEAKYGIRDYRGGGRASGRETIGRVLCGAVCMQLLKELSVDVFAYTRSIGEIEADPARFERAAILESRTAMPDREADEKAVACIEALRAKGDSAGGVAECIMRGVPAGLGDPVFDKLDALLSHAVMSIGAVKAVEIGDGILAATAQGSSHNDAFAVSMGSVTKKSNHAGGILGGISDGSDIVLRAHIKPTPSIASGQQTVTKDKKEVSLHIKGRHDPVIVPRAVVVIECMCAFVLTDALLGGMPAQKDAVLAHYRR
ncbi:MAG: chorismate synthase [Lachnospiraceae bacterium]|nr:chorismate synthase [Lachnospiraceae bacterium]